MSSQHSPSQTTHRSPARARHARGFTLIELLVVLVIAGILAAVAIPNYSSYVVRGKRSAARAALLEAAGALERNRSVNGCYNKTTMAACSASPQPSGSNFALNVTLAPAERGSYIITVPTLTATTFTLRATPCGTAGNCPAGNDLAFSDAECGIYVLSETGARSNASNTASSATCWDR